MVESFNMQDLRCLWFSGWRLTQQRNQESTDTLMYNNFSRKKI